MKTIPDLDLEFAALVGDLSEEINDCCYNDDSILCAALHGMLNEQLAARDKRHRDYIARLYPDYPDLDARVIELIKLTGGWPMNFGEPVTPLKELPEKYYLEYFRSSGREDLLQ